MPLVYLICNCAISLLPGRLLLVQKEYRSHRFQWSHLSPCHWSRGEWATGRQGWTPGTHCHSHLGTGRGLSSMAPGCETFHPRHLDGKTETSGPLRHAKGLLTTGRRWVRSAMYVYILFITTFSTSHHSSLKLGLREGWINSPKTPQQAQKYLNSTNKWLITKSKFSTKKMNDHIKKGTAPSQLFHKLMHPTRAAPRSGWLPVTGVLTWPGFCCVGGRNWKVSTEFNRGNSLGKLLRERKKLTAADPPPKTPGLSA